MSVYPPPGRLDGITVAVTRSADRATSLIDMLVELGANVVGVPVIATEPPADGGAALAEALGHLAADDVVVVTSARGVEALVEHDCRRDVATAAVGAATARALEAHGFRTPAVPDRQMARHLGEALGPPFGTGSVLFAAAEAASEDAEMALAGLGWRVTRVDAYRTAIVDVDPVVAAVAGRADVAVFTSGSTVRGWCRHVPGGVAGVSIGPSTSSVMATHGIDVVAQAHTHDLDGLCAAVVGYVHGRS